MTEPKTPPDPQLHCPADLPPHPELSYRPGRELELLPGGMDAGVPRPGAGTVVSLGHAAPGDSIDATSAAERHVAETSHGFELREFVGRGGFGEVWQALQASLRRIVAVKRLRPDTLDPDAFDERTTAARMKAQFLEEAITTANLDHPNIVPVHDLGVDEDGMPLMAMKLVRGTPWDQLLRQDGAALDPADFLARHVPVLVDVAQAVAFAHSRGVIHRDLKPSQVMVGEFGEVLLADWGLAVVTDPGKLEHLRQDSGSPVELPTPATATSPAGTPAFMAPEQTERTAAGIGPWTDVFLLGGTLYYLLCLKPPHQGDSPRDTFLKARLAEVPDPRTKVNRREMPTDLVELAMEAMAADPVARVPSAQAFLERLQGHLSGAVRRRESLEITARVQDRLGAPRHDYGDFGENLSELTRATALWGDNPHVAPLRQQTRAGWARAALANRDLVLARLQIDQMEQDESRARLVSGLEAAESAVHRRERQRRIAVWSARLLLVAFILSAAVFGWRLKEQRDRARIARDDARALVTFMLDDLADALADTGQLEPFQRVGNAVLGYFRQLPAEEQTTQTDQLELWALITLVRTQIEMGDSGAATRNLAAMRPLIQRLERDRPDDIQVITDHAYALALEGVLESQVGTDDEAVEKIAEGWAFATRRLLELPDGQLATQGIDPADIAALRDIIPGPGALDGLVDDPSLLGRIYPHIARICGGRDAVWHSESNKIIFFFGRSLARMGRGEDAADLYRVALDVTTGQLEEFGNDPSLLLDAFRFLVTLGDQARDAGRLQQARALYEEAFGLFEEEGRNNPLQREALTSRTIAAQRLAGVVQRTGDLGMAERIAVAGAEAGRELTLLDPLNAIWALYYVGALNQLADIQFERGDLDAATAGYEQALMRGLALFERDPGNLDNRRALATASGRAGELAGVLRLKENNPAAERLETLLLRLPGELRGNGADP